MLLITQAAHTFFMSNATFHNFTEKPFTGWWDGKSKTFKAGEKKYMPAYLAEHFAKHLTNQVLVEAGHEVYTSPKNPSQVPQFMEIFKKAYIPDLATKDENSLDAEISRANEPSMDVHVKETEDINTGPAAALADMTGPGDAPQVITTPEGDSDDESGFDLGTK